MKRTAVSKFVRVPNQYGSPDGYWIEEEIIEGEQPVTHAPITVSNNFQPQFDRQGQPITATNPAPIQYDRPPVMAKPKSISFPTIVGLVLGCVAVALSLSIVGKAQKAEQLESQVATLQQTIEKQNDKIAELQQANIQVTAQAMQLQQQISWTATGAAMVK